jgi:hypothetical protein
MMVVMMVVMMMLMMMMMMLLMKVLPKQSLHGENLYTRRLLHTSPFEPKL